MSVMAEQQISTSNPNRGAPAEPVVEVRNLTKSYGGQRVVDDVGFTVARGEIFGLLGSNGAGKTTTVECAQGLRRADGGEVRVLGYDPLRNRGELRGRVGSQLQDSQLPDRLRVAEALRLFADTPARVDAAMAAWKLTDLARQPFASLSGGQRQRLFLALALLNQPEVVFLDELTQGLDPNARRSVWKLIEQVRDQGTTVVLVTHFMEEAEVLCDRVAVMRSGCVVDTGTPNELVESHGRGVRMRFAAEPADLDWLRSLPGVVSAEMAGAEVEVTGQSSAMAYIGAEFVARDRVPSTIRMHQPNLEDALLTLIDPNEA